MSRAKDQFDKSIKDAEELLAHFEAARPAPDSPPPPNAEVLKRAGLILAVMAWEHMSRIARARPRWYSRINQLLRYHHDQ
jgi:hypothetical protein